MTAGVENKKGRESGHEAAAWSGVESKGGAVAALLSGLRAAGRVPVWAVLYADRERVAALEALLVEHGAWTDWPLMVLCSGAAGSPGGLQIHSRPAAGVRPLRDGVRVAGMAWTTPAGREASLCGVLPAGGLARGASVRDLLERSAALLGQAGMGWGDVHRTWYYNDSILDWYGEFNTLRRDYYQGQGVSLDRPPASTGIGLANAWGRPLTLAALAALPHAQPGPVPSPLQNEPRSYGSYFSRASEQATAQGRALTVSGTASIDRTGRTVHAGDFDAQVRQTCRVVEALLASRGMGWGDVCRATAYVRRPSDLGRWRALEAEGVVPDFPRVVLPAVVCREDLLFELEVEALQ